jgi:putative transposase
LWAGWKAAAVPKPYPREFRDDVVRVARERDPGVTVDQIAKDFGVHPMTLFKWLRRAEADDNTERVPGGASGESVELREARKRIGLLEQENEVLRRAAAYLSQAHRRERIYPLVNELAADGIPVAVTCRVLNIARQPYYRWLARPVTDAEVTEAYRADALFDAHRDDPEFDYRFRADEAGAAGEAMADRIAWRTCSGNGWWSAFGKRGARQKPQGRTARPWPIPPAGTRPRLPARPPAGI